MSRPARGSAVGREVHLRKLLHITDVHFGRQHRPDRSAGLVRLAAERQPDVVVFSGDLTKRAKPAEFRQAREFVDALGAPTLVIPGNHDVPMYRVWERVLRPYGAYRKHFATDLEPTWRDEELEIIGVNTAHGWTIDGGRVGRRQLGELDRRLAGDRGGRFTIVAQHHQMIPVPDYGSDHVFRNARQTAATLARHRVDLVLSGHVHLSYLGDSSAIEPDLQPAVPVLFSGTACSSRGRGPEEGRNTCHWIEVDEQNVTLDRLEWQVDAGAFRATGQTVLERPAKRG